MKHAYNHCCIVSKDTGEITVEQKRINNALSENCNGIIKLVTKAANGYRNWERFRNRRMLIFKKGIDFEIDKDNGSIKIVEKKRTRTTKCCPSPKLAINRFGVYAAP